MSSVFRRGHRPISVAVLGVALAAALVPGASPASAAKKKKKATPAKVTISKVAAKGAKVTVTGKVTLPSTLKNTAKSRKKVKVSLTLTGTGGKQETFTAAITSKRAFTGTKTTKLSGVLGVSAQVKVGGKKSGKPSTKGKAVTVTGSTGTNGSGDKGSTPGPPTPAPNALTPSPTPTTPTPDSPSAQSQPLVGLFKLDPGAQAVSGALSGTYFRMYGVQNAESTALDKNYTLLRPGTDGGLRTDRFQPSPTPAFAGVDPTDPSLPSGDALADTIVQPQTFFAVKFSIVTDPVARGTNTDGSLSTAPVQLPSIVNTDGALSGQTSAWTAAWNGLWFTQGSPKPDGTYPKSPTSGQPTTPVSGTYDPATRHYVLTWQSLIQGGPFNNFVGLWHLEGTFVPAAP